MNLIELRDKFCLSKYRSSYGTFKGYEVPGNFATIQSDIENFEVYDDDVWVTTFPKSGTTWIQEIVWLITNNLDYEGANVNIDERCPFIEISALYDIPRRINSVDEAKNLKRPRVIKTHLPWELLPKQIQTFERRPKIINVTRNAKDVCVSYYHHSKKREFYSGDMEMYFELFLGDKLGYCPFFKHQRSYASRREEPNLLHLQYEDMLQDLHGQIKKTADFLKIQLSDEDVDKLAKHSAFDSMKKNSAVQHKARATLFPNSNFDADGFFRKGVSGEHTEVMSDEMNRRFDEWIEKNCG